MSHNEIYQPLWFQVGFEVTLTTNRGSKRPHWKSHNHVFVYIARKKKCCIKYVSFFNDVCVIFFQVGPHATKMFTSAVFPYNRFVSFQITGKILVAQRSLQQYWYGDHFEYKNSIVYLKWDMVKRKYKIGKKMCVHYVKIVNIPTF